MAHINDLRDNVICNTAVYADNSSFYSKCKQAFDLWHHILMTFVIMLSVILLSMLMIVCSSISVSRHLICGSIY